MKKIRRAYTFFKSKYKLLSRKKYTTLAGTLVFFLVMSILPFTFWLTLIVGKLPINTGNFFSLSVFDSVKNIFSYVQKEAENATTSVSIILLVTTLYSSTNFFYQMRRSGEIIYDYNPKKQAFHLRLSALVLMFMVMLMVIVFLFVLGVGTFLFSRFLSQVAELVADYLLLMTLSFALVLLLNMYICPHKVPVKYFLGGTVWTVGAWTIAVIGFAVYLKISSVEKLYGALSTVIVFLLWLYVLMVCFIIGVIFNGEKVLKTERKIRNAQKNKNSKRAHTLLYEKS